MHIAAPSFCVPGLPFKNIINLYDNNRRLYVTQNGTTSSETHEIW